MYSYDELEYDKFRAINNDGLNEIIEAVNLFNKEIEEVKRHRALKKLTEQNLVKEIKRNISYIWADEMILKEAQKWLSIRDDCDKRRKYDEKNYFDLLRHNISEALDEDIVINKINSCGHECYSYNIHFTIDKYDYNFILEVPIIKHMTVENREHTLDGKLLFGYEEDRSCRKMHWHSYNLRDFKDAIKEITTSDKHKKHVSSKGNE